MSKGDGKDKRISPVKPKTNKIVEFMSIEINKKSGNFKRKTMN